MVQKPLGASGPLRQRKTHRATLKDIKQASWLKGSLKGEESTTRRPFLLYQEKILVGYYGLNSSF